MAECVQATQKSGNTGMMMMAMAVMMLAAIMLMSLQLCMMPAANAPLTPSSLDAAVVALQPFVTSVSVQGEPVRPSRLPVAWSRDVSLRREPLW